MPLVPEKDVVAKRFGAPDAPFVTFGILVKFFPMCSTSACIRRFSVPLELSIAPRTTLVSNVELPRLSVVVASERYWPSEETAGAETACCSTITR